MQKGLFVRLNKPLKAFVTPVIALAFIGGVNSTAQAEVASDPLSASEAADLAYVRASLSDKGVAPATVDALIAKLRRGEALDADTGAKAVSTRTFTDRRGRHTIYTYPDGSAAEGIVELPTAAATGPVPSLISGCSKTVSRDVHTFKGCRVSWDAATWSMSYRANYDYYQFGANITKLSGITIGGIGMDNEGTEIIDGHAQGRSDIARARGYAKQKISIAGVGVNRTVGIDLKVSAAWGKAKESSFGG